MWEQFLYVNEKLDQFEGERRQRQLPRPPAPRRRHRLIGPLVATTGRRVRRFGEALESWAAPTAGQMREDSTR